MDPLLDFSGLPRFAEFKPDHVTPAMDQLLAENRELIARQEADGREPSWENFVAPLDDANERLRRAWGQVAHTNAVMNSPALREAYNANLGRITQYFTELSQSEALFRKYKALRASADFSKLTQAQRKVIDNELRDFRLGGAELPAERKARFKQVSERLAQLSSKFNDNLLDTTNAYELIIQDRAQLSGIPDDVLEAAHKAAAEAGKTGWKFTLQMPSYLPVMQYADNHDLRERLYHAYATRASEFGNPAWDNTALISEILKLRREQAQLLGFKTFAELSLQPKMADSPAQVLGFLDELAARAKPYAERDLAELEEFAVKQLGLAELQPWDVAYASEKLRVARYAFSDQEVKQYFPEQQVLAGMFRVVETLYGLSITADEAPRWHEDVRFFSIRNADGVLVGQFYLDLYARPSKRGGAWMDDAITRRRKDVCIQTPVAYLNCNFSAPVGGRQAMFTHDEVITLFHEFGHGLHHLLTRVDVLGVSGINGVEWDAVELPSQFMENFCWEWDVLKDMTRHADGGQSLPRALFDKMVAAKNFQSGMQTVRQLEFALFDMHLHHDFDPAASKTPLDLLDEVRRRVAVIIPPAYNRFPHGFSHIFGGGYAAGYYSYKWAEVLSADAYSLFEESGVLNTVVGERFREEILAAGGSRPALESFVAFRGREPKIDALLRHNGMAVA
ncbi:MAG TPA: M3 family metallopeptidase [Burkholderiales bacterium]|jgi:oligopeptidase A|nr:M3 family metallopeptidase [Burkholderiales bacterium]